MNGLPPIWDIYWPTLALVIIAGIGAVIAIRTLKNIEQQTRDAKEAIILTHRPKIVIRSVVIPWAAILNRKAPMNAGDDLEEGLFNGFFYAVNVGNQLATIRTLDEYMLLSDRLPMERPYEAGRHQRTVGITLTPGEACKIVFKPTQVGVDKMAEMAVSEKPFIVIGRLTYTDALGNCRETAFCRQLNRATNRLMPVDDPDYEYAD
jgi:hypothetical protein